MPTTAENEYQDKLIADFDIQIVATQYTYESDAFDNKYDENACLHSTKTVVAGTPATCTTPRLTEGVKCANTKCNAVLVAQQTIDTLGHTEVIDEAVAPTCAQTGLTQGSHCSVCSAPIIEQEVVSATGHTESDWIVDVEPDERVDGERHIECTECNTVIRQEIIPALPVSPIEFEEKDDGTCSAVAFRDKHFYKDHLNIPETYRGMNVTEIGFYAFSASSIQGVTISNGVTTIGEGAFMSCENLTNVTIPSSVTTIGMLAFAYCYELNSITFEGTVTQWNSIYLDYDWNYGAPAKYVQCSGGVVPLT